MPYTTVGKQGAGQLDSGKPAKRGSKKVNHTGSASMPKPVPKEFLKKGGKQMKKKTVRKPSISHASDLSLDIADDEDFETMKKSATRGLHRARHKGV